MCMSLILFMCIIFTFPIKVSILTCYMQDVFFKFALKVVPGRVANPTQLTCLYDHSYYDSDISHGVRARGIGMYSKVLAFHTNIQFE